ncbi:MAG: metallophosphoesterase family protein [Clostridium sp.]|nr:metallophosphoesterase family protein [Clostridium sp.]MCM1399135.1 metallophosphoesterase family protein [Clostridium sp.]MCM1459527.1 metallophosphoesterase family protein [Bacteroides sp.]
MKILLLADEESKYYWDFFEKKKLENIDLIISCGDLAPQFLSFLATFSKVPILYVKGNHDYCYDETPPDGCICIDDDIYVHEGVKIMGLGGCMSYNYGPLQFTEEEMKKRAKKLRRKAKKLGGIDVLITHSPAYRLNDGQDLPHTGFQVFLDLMDEYKPQLFAHGHVHINYGRDFKRESTYNGTKVINAFEKYIVEI